MNTVAYLQELKFALSAPRNWRSKLALLSATMRFHLGNKFGHTASRGEPIALDIWIGANARTVYARPYSGDIFILYEVLAFKAYQLPLDDVDPARVFTIVDCGANIGMTSLYFADRYPHARILAIEPDPENYRLLCLNVAAEPRILPLQAAVVGQPTSKILLSQDRPAWGNSVVVGARMENAVEIDAITLDQLFDRYALQRVDLLKVDIEGAEVDVFAAPSFLDRVQYVVVELHDDYTLDRFGADIVSKGFVARPPGGHDGPHAVTAVRKST